MSLKPLPIGTDLFRKLRENNAYYVDKTPIIKEIVTNASDVHLFTRPRRFGKTLTMSMLNEYFSVIGDKSIFDGLAITEEKQICDAYMGKSTNRSITDSCLHFCYRAATGTLRRTAKRERDGTIS